MLHSPLISLKEQQFFAEGHVSPALQPHCKLCAKRALELDFLRQRWVRLAPDGPAQHCALLQKLQELKRLKDQEIQTLKQELLRKRAERRQRELAAGECFALRARIAQELAEMRG